ncbi:hypothetical protein [Pararhizobium sp. IMCC21322]|uniref:hypothetical protein n=1 Tax=Pararhizobium sp. IMCC21322 TaxID=3067903 RepID=UPI002741D851|nr:hypothetical protein [Pararhizobium sp. IMCC21322]
MIEAALYFALGALSVSLLLFVILPIVSGRARRLAIHELERQAPVSLSEITAQKDQMRARFAVELNRQEKRADQLQVESQQHLVTAEKWRIFAERVEQEFEKLKNEYAGLKKKISTAEVTLEKQKEIAKSALKTMTGQEKKRLFELEEEVEELRSEKSAANVRIVSMQTELNNAQSRVAEMERHMPSLEELNLRKELKALAEDVSAFVKSTPPPAPIAQPAPVVAAKPAPAIVAKPSVVEPPLAVKQAPAVIAALDKPKADTPTPVVPTSDVPKADAPKSDRLTPDKPAPEPKTPANQIEKAAASMAVIPAFLKPAAERQYPNPSPINHKPETAAPASQATDTASPKIATFQFGRSNAKLTSAEPQKTSAFAADTTPPKPQDTSVETVPKNTVVTSEKPIEAPAVSMAINGKASLLKEEVTANSPGITAAKTGDQEVTNTAIVSGRRLKQDKPFKTKKSGFAGVIAAVSRNNKGAMSSGANGKVKPSPLHYNGKMSGKQMAAKPATLARPADSTGAEAIGAKPESAAQNVAEATPKDSIAAKNRKKIMKFGKKVRRIKTATASS